MSCSPRLCLFGVSELQPLRDSSFLLLGLSFIPGRGSPGGTGVGRQELGNGFAWGLGRWWAHGKEDEAGNSRIVPMAIYT